MKTELVFNPCFENVLERIQYLRDTITSLGVDQEIFLDTLIPSVIEPTKVSYSVLEDLYDYYGSLSMLIVL